MKVLVIGAAWVGDIIMSQVLFKYLKASQPSVEIDVMVPAYARGIVERMEQVNRVLVLPFKHGELNLKKRYQLGCELQQIGYAHAFVLPNSFKSALIPWFAKVPKRTGWRGEWRYALLNDIRVLKKANYPLMIQRFLALGMAQAATLPASLVDYYPQLDVDQLQQQAVCQRFNLTAGKKILALCPGAAYGSSKRWPVHHFASLAKHFLAEGWSVWYLGGPQEKVLVKAILAETQGQGEDLCATSLTEAIDLLALADVAVANDSGLMHMAAAVATPLVALYGSSSPKFTPPLATAAVEQFDLTLPCKPCFKRECPLQHHACMEDILPQQVATVIDKLAAAKVSK